LKRRLRLAFLLAIVGAAALSTVALAGDVTGSDSSGDVRAPGLTAAERAAIDVVRVEAVGQANLGVVVTATFRGNFEQAVGRGHLKTALAALVLVPKAGAGAPAGVVTQGAGDVGTALRKTRSTNVGAVRDGKTVTFYVIGGGYENVASVEVRTLAKVPPSTRRTLYDGEPAQVSDRTWSSILKSPTERAALEAGVGDLSCPELSALKSSIERRLRTIERKLRRKRSAEGRVLLQHDHAALLGLLGEVNTRLASCGGAPPPAPGFSCTMRTQRDSVFPTIEVNIHTGCTTLIRSATLTFPTSQSIIAFLPSGCSASGNVLTCPNLAIPANTDFEIDARFNTPFGPNAPFTGLFVSGPGASVTVNGTFPGP
jgi:hypothetical protein